MAPLPTIGARAKIEEDVAVGEMEVWVKIPKSTDEGFDVCIQFFDNWEINVLAGECVVDFFLSDKKRNEERNRKRIDEAIDLAIRLLTPRCRVRQWYRGNEVYKGYVEAETSGVWKVEAVYRRPLWCRKLFAGKTERILKNNLLL